MLDTVILIAMSVVGVAFVLCLYRLLRGPAMPDRILALDTMYINAIALIILFGMWRDSGMWYEAALLIALLGFVGTVALTKYLLRGDIIE